MNVNYIEDEGRQAQTVKAELNSKSKVKYMSLRPHTSPKN